MAGFIAGVGYVDCDHVLAVTLLTVSWGFSGLIGVGPHISALDMSPQHAGLRVACSTLPPYLVFSLCPRPYVKVNCTTLLLGMGGVLISLSKAMSP